MKHKILEAMLLALPLTMAAPVMAAPPEGDAEGVGEGGDAADEITEEEALEDDILLVIDLPVAADEARDAGLDEAEIDEALDAGDTGAVSPGTMAEVLDEETEQVRAKGKRKAFGQWVKQQIADGVRGKELAEKIKERKEELEALTDEQKAEIEAKIKEAGDKHRERRKKIHEKRKELREQGKEVLLAGKERHDKMVAKASERLAADRIKFHKGRAKFHEGRDGKDAGPPGDGHKADAAMEKHEDKKEAHAGHGGGHDKDDKGGPMKGPK